MVWPRSEGELIIHWQPISTKLDYPDNFRPMLHQTDDATFATCLHTSQNLLSSLDLYSIIPYTLTMTPAMFFEEHYLKVRIFPLPQKISPRGLPIEEKAHSTWCGRGLRGLDVVGTLRRR